MTDVGKYLAGLLCDGPGNECGACRLREYVRALEAVATAARQEHGGRHHEPECPLCVAVAALAPPSVGEGGG